MLSRVDYQRYWESRSSAMQRIKKGRFLRNLCAGVTGVDVWLWLCAAFRTKVKRRLFAGWLVSTTIQRVPICNLPAFAGFRVSLVLVCASMSRLVWDVHPKCSMMPPADGFQLQRALSWNRGNSIEPVRQTSNPNSCSCLVDISIPSLVYMRCLHRWLVCHAGRSYLE